MAKVEDPMTHLTSVDDTPVRLTPKRILRPGRRLGIAAIIALLLSGCLVEDESTDEKMPEPMFYTARCRDGVVDKIGRALRAQATVEPGGGVAIAIETRCGSRDTACTPRRDVRIEGAGVAIELDDVDHDGTIEVITSGAGAPGDADAVAVWNIGESGVSNKPVFRRGFSGGVVGLGSGDIDGDGDGDVVAAVRLAGARKVDLWVLD